MKQQIGSATVLKLKDTTPASVDSFIQRFSVLVSEGKDAQFIKQLLQEAIETFGERHDILWARLKLLQGGQNEQISGAPFFAGRWLGLDPEAVTIARTVGNEDDYCKSLLVYDWMAISEVEDLVSLSQTWLKKDNIGRAISVAAETLMYRHGEFDRACELLRAQFTLYDDDEDEDDDEHSIVERAKTLVRMTMAQLAAGQLPEAVTTRDRAKEMVSRLGPDFIIYEHAGTKSGGDLYPEISMESNFAWYIEGDWQAVADHWVFACSLEEPGGSPVHVIEAGMAAQAFARLNQFDRCNEILGELVTLLKKLKPRDWGLNGAVGRASHAIWDMEAYEYADDFRNLALSLLAAGVGDWTNTSLELTVARTATLLGRATEASAYFTRARNRLSLKQIDPRLGIIDFDEAKAIRLLNLNESEKRQVLLAGANETFQSLGMHGWSSRVLAELKKD